MLILVYQKTLSPDHGLFRALYPHGFCRFHPSCSQYTKEAIVKYGLVKGFVLGVYRLLRCNPWSKPGLEQV